MTDRASAEPFRCNCPHEVRSGCSEPRCPHYVKPARDRASAEREGLLNALRDVRQELWVDYCLHRGRTDVDPSQFNAKPHIRIIDAALASVPAAHMDCSRCDQPDRVNELAAKAPSSPDARDDMIALLQKQIEELTDPELKSMRFEDGRFNMELAGETVKRLALIMTEWFRESGAKNYVEMTLHAKTEPFESFQFYVQKQGDGAKTPHQLRAEAEAERNQLRIAVERARKNFDEIAMLGAGCKGEYLPVRMGNIAHAASIELSSTKKTSGDNDA